LAVRIKTFKSWAIEAEEKALVVIKAQELVDKMKAERVTA
jgi:hypothetical protein